MTCLLRNLYAGQEATFRTGHGPTKVDTVTKLFIKGNESNWTSNIVGCFAFTLIFESVLNSYDHKHMRLSDPSLHFCIKEKCR